MKIRLNGRDVEFMGSSILDLLSSYSIDPQTVVVEKNGEIGKRENFKSEIIEEGDRLEIVRLVGGGTCRE